MPVFAKKLRPKNIVLSVCVACIFTAIAPIFSDAKTNEIDTDIQAIKNNLANRKPAINAKKITPSPIAGLYEVFANGNIFYVDKSTHYVIVNGSVIDDVNKKNLTNARLKELTSIAFDSLPFKNAIEIKKGSGAYKFAVFSDPDCPYCKSLEQGLEKMNMTDYTAYIFLFPIKELHPDAVQKAESIWCAKDKAAAWSSFMIKDTSPEKTTCVNPIKENEILADTLGVAGTPTIYLQNGQMTQSPEELVAAMHAK